MLAPARALFVTSSSRVTHARIHIHALAKHTAVACIRKKQNDGPQSLCHIALYCRCCLLENTHYTSGHSMVIKDRKLKKKSHQGNNSALPPHMRKKNAKQSSHSHTYTSQSVTWSTTNKRRRGGHVRWRRDTYLHVFLFIIFQFAHVTCRAA